MDGRVLTEALVGAAPVTGLDTSVAPVSDSSTPYTPAEEAIITARLRALGYLEPA
jgi:hypothetical protein